MDKLPYIVALDFDGTIVKQAYPEIGEPNHRFIQKIRKMQAENPTTRWVLWTCRTEKHLDDAVKFCYQQGLRFDAVNRNIDEVIKMFGHDTRKVYADVYVDDKNGVGWLYE